MNLRRLKLTSINAAPYNPRVDLKPDDPRYQALAKSMDEFGLVQPLVFNKRTKTLVAGHQRLKVLLARGESHAESVVVDLPLEKEQALNLALNKVSGAWDKDKLADRLDELVKIPELDLAVTGFEIPEVGQLLEGLRPLEDSDESFDLESALEDGRPPVTQPGDLIELGRHGEERLLGGDAADRAGVQKVRGSQRARTVHSEPPDGVSYDATRRQRIPGKEGKSRLAPEAHRARNGRLLNDHLSPARYATWVEGVCDELAHALRAGGAF